MNIINKVVSIKQLVLDPNNLRLDYELVEEEYKEEQFLGLQEKTLERLENENVDELRESILSNGFLEIDRIVVKKSTKLADDDNVPYYIVIEGNRRTAALKGLYDDYINSNINVSESLQAQFESINVCCIDSNDAFEVESLSASLMGIRHVSGPKQWKGIQSAKLIAQLRDKGREFDEIAALLSISPKDTIRRYQGYLAFIQMKKDPVYGRRCRSNHYALLLESLSNNKAKAWLGWNGEIFENTHHLHIIYEHLVTSESDPYKPEISNTTTARQFNRHLEIEEDRTRLENNELLSSLPDLPKSTESKINHIKRFISFVNNIPYEDLYGDLAEQLNELQSELETRLGDKRL